jgi:hypothetical protein
MCEALKELMKDEIEAARKEGWKEGWEEGWKEGIAETIYSLVSEGEFPRKGERRSSGFPLSSLKSDMDAWAERMAYYGD